MFVVLFFFFAIFHIIIRELQPGSYVDYLSKPLPILFIIIWVLLKKDEWVSWYSFSGKIFIGLLFGLTGDILLMFPNLFLPGLVSFLIGHIFYIIAFYPDTKINFLYSTPLLLLGISMAFYLSDKTGDMLIPVMFYLVVILTMSWMSLCRQKEFSNYNTLVWGSIFFILSDSFLALVKFTGLETGLNSSIIMGTYYLAQYFIGYRGVKLR